MPESPLDVVTGAFGYSGKYITELLLARGRRVRTLTSRWREPHSLGPGFTAAPFNFDRPDALCAELAGADTLYNTYWVRFPHGEHTHERAIENTRTLIRAAREAGVRRLVHVSIANPTEDSPLPYYRGKALLEREIAASGLSHAILRPTVIFGPEDILINNIAWFVRRFPVFGVPGSGRYGIQPIFVEDFARLAVEAGERRGNEILDAAGPEQFSFEELVRLIAHTLGRRVKTLHVAPALAWLFTRLVGLSVGDVILTRDEIRGLMGDLLVSHQQPTGTTRLSDWLRENAQTVGKTYASELRRHFRPVDSSNR
jgi:uncharacterized protein YbjT (DUF2867 family)